MIIYSFKEGMLHADCPKCGYEQAYYHLFRLKYYCPDCDYYFE